MRTRDKILFVLLFFSFINSNSQNLTGLPEFLPPSPEAASVGKYGQHSVNLNTGTPNISIPLYTIQLKDFSFPISISYNASGIKVNEIASRVGLGWTLNAGGAISVNTVGLSDEAVGITMPSADETFAPYWTSGPYPPDYSLALDLLNTELYNTEPDMYIYNFMGYTGKYVNSIYGSLTLPYSNEVSFEGTTATDKTGNRYFFGATESQSTSKSCLTSSPADPYTNAITAYYLSMIITAAGDSVILHYSQDGYSYYLSTSETKHFRAPGEDVGGCPMPEFDYDRCRTQASVGLPKLDSIIATNGIVVKFEYGHERIDVETAEPNPTYMITGIRVKHQSLSNTVSLHYQFDYDDVGNEGDDVEETANGTRTYLKSLTMSDNGKYAFKYYHPELLPLRDSYDVDYWGYYNAAGNTTLLPSASWVSFSGATRTPNEFYAQYGTLDTLVYPTGGYTVFEFEGHKSSVNSLYFSGGLRIKSITDHDANNSITEKKNYSYPSFSGGFATDPFVAQYFFTPYITRKTVESTLTQNHCQFYILHNTSTPVLGGYAFNTSLKYGEVVVQHENEEKSGKSRYLFRNIPFDVNGIPFIDGLDEVKPTVEEHYKYTGAGFEILNRKRYTYKVYNHTEATWEKDTTLSNNYGQVIGFRIKQVLPEQSTFAAEFDWFYYRYGSVWYHLDSLIETTYNEDDSLVAYQLFEHEKPIHAQLTKTTTYNSLGDTLVKVMRYPQDYEEEVSDTDKVIQDLDEDQYRTIRGLPIEVLDFKNSKLVSGVMNRWKSEDDILKLSKKYVTRIRKPLVDNDFPAANDRVFSFQPGGDPYHLLYEVDQADARGNPTQLDNQNGRFQSLIWDAETHNVLAIVENASLGQIAFTNFDTDEKGGWTYTGGYETHPDSIYSGLRSFEGTSVTKTLLNPEVYYKVSVRAKRRTPTINGEAATMTAGSGGWNLYEKVVSDTSSITITIPSGGKMDDARLHPVTSQMVTFSHHPLFGILCKTDANNFTQFYEYDTVGRLKLIRDDDRNILKSFQYNYMNSVLTED